MILNPVMGSLQTERCEFIILNENVMKTKNKALLIMLVLLFSSALFPAKVLAQQPYVSFQVFYDELSPYGSWVNYPNYGYVWLPDAGPDFVPYSTNGHWVYTEYGWTWFSNFEWGWAPFHYGRWNFDHYYGWFWVPDGEWGPAWVSWRSAEGYYGWSPLEPGISISLSFGRSYDRYDDHWVFVRDRDIDRADINNYYLGQTDHDRIVRRSSVISNSYHDKSRNTTYITGPDRTQFQKVTGRSIKPVVIQEYNKPGEVMRNGQISIYRPKIRETRDYSQRTEPSRITNLKDVKQSSERNLRTRQDNIKPPSNINQGQQQNTANPQRNTSVSQPQNIRRDVQQNDTRQQVNKQQNVRKDVQQNNVKQQSNPPQNLRREVQQNNVKQQNNPPQNIRKEKQSNTSNTATEGNKDQKKKTEKADERIKRE
jgi:hypothetical protein